MPPSGYIWKEPDITAVRTADMMDHKNGPVKAYIDNKSGSRLPYKERI
jgi:hypothetical protein